MAELGRGSHCYLRAWVVLSSMLNWMDGAVSRGCLAKVQTFVIGFVCMFTVLEAGRRTPSF